jgi:uroporphyrinogen-III synthase
MKSLLLLRPEPRSSEFAAVLDARLPGKFRVEIAPLMRIIPVPVEVDLFGIGAVLFTSANGVEHFTRISADRSLPAFCVGSMTASAALSSGFDARSASGDVEALADLVIARHDPQSGACLHVRGVHAAGDLTGRLEAAGIEARAVELYEQVAAEIDGPVAELLEAGGIDIVTVFSPRTARLFAQQAERAGWPLDSACSVALSASAGAPLDPLPFRARHVAPFAGREGMIEVLRAV